MNKNIVDFSKVDEVLQELEKSFEARDKVQAWMNPIDAAEEVAEARHELTKSVIENELGFPLEIESCEVDKKEGNISNRCKLKNTNASIIIDRVGIVKEVMGKDKEILDKLIGKNARRLFQRKFMQL